MKALLFLSLAAHFVLGHNYPYTGTYGLKLKPPFLTMLDDAEYGAPVGVTLKSRPKTKVTVFFEMPHFSSSKCRIDFTPDNWNKEQIIRVTRLPYLTPGDAKRVTEGSFLVFSPGEKYHQKRQKYQIIRPGGAGATCTAWGDPHYVSFAGKAFDFQGIGPYYLIKTPLLTIQQFNLPFGRSTAMIQKKIAIRYHKTVYVFDADRNRCDLASDANENVEIHTLPGVTWRAQLSDGTMINITRAAYAPCNYMNISIVIGTIYKKKINGLCGLYEVPAKAQLIMPNGAAAPNPTSFGHSWRVPENDSLFALGDKAACVKAPEDPNAGVGGVEICALPEPDELEGNGEEDFDKGEKVVKDVERLDLVKEVKTMKVELLKPVVPPKAPADPWAKQARTKCVAMLTIKEANAIIDSKIYVDDCVDDCVLSGTFDFLDEAKERYLAAVRRVTNSALDEPAVRDGENKVAEELKKKAKDVAEKAGLGRTPCPSDCSEQGVCTPDGCECHEGFNGVDCSEKSPENPDKAKAFTDKKAPPEIAAQDAPQPKIFADVKAAEKLEAANLAKKLKEAEKGGAKA